MTVSGTPLESGYFNPDFTFIETGSGSTLHMTEGFSISNTTTQTYTYMASPMSLDTGSWPIANAAQALTRPPIRR